MTAVESLMTDREARFTTVIRHTERRLQANSLTSDNVTLRYRLSANRT